MDYGDDVMEGKHRGMRVGLNVCGAEGDRALAYKGVRAEAAGKNCRVCFMEANLRTVYMRGEDGGIHQVPQVMETRTWPHTGKDRVRMKEK